MIEQCHNPKIDKERKACRFELRNSNIRTKIEFLSQS